MARSNGGIIGKTNKTSFGKCTVTSKTSSGCISLQPGTRIIDAAVVAGGGGGSSGGGGAGGLRQFSNLNACGSIPATIGAGGAANGSSGANSVLVAGGTTYTSNGGGFGAVRSPSPALGGDGGSGGGAGGDGNNPSGGGCGNTPPTSPPQGNNGGNAPTTFYQAGAGGAPAPCQARRRANERLNRGGHCTIEGKNLIVVVGSRYSEKYSLLAK